MYPRQPRVTRKTLCKHKDWEAALVLANTAHVHTLGVQWKFLELFGQQKEAEGYAKAAVAQLRGVLSRSLDQETEYNRITQRTIIGLVKGHTSSLDPKTQTVNPKP